MAGTNISLEREVQPIIENMVSADPIIVPNPLNYISQPPEDSESQPSIFLESTQVNETQMDDFLHNSWADLADLEEDPMDKDGAFTNAISILKNK